MESILLIGTEAVQNAGSSMRSAAEQMQRAANQIDESLRMHQRFLDDWLAQFRDAMEPKP